MLREVKMKKEYKIIIQAVILMMFVCTHFITTITANPLIHLIFFGFETGNLIVDVMLFITILLQLYLIFIDVKERK